MDLTDLKNITAESVQKVNYEENFYETMKRVENSLIAVLIISFILLLLFFIFLYMKKTNIWREYLIYAIPLISVNTTIFLISSIYLFYFKRLNIEIAFIPPTISLLISIILFQIWAWKFDKN